MKVLKWLLISVLALVLVLGIGITALVYLMDWNKLKDTIQNQVKQQTGRDLVIAGDLEPSVFPWAGVSIGDISLANAEGFGEQPFAEVGNADVKVELLPLIRRVINIRTVELAGLSLDLQRAADGTTNWDDLVDGTSTTTQTTEDEGTEGEVVTTEVEGSSATIAALEVGGINVSDANVSWNDAQSGTDAKLSGFNLQTGAIALEEPFDLSTGFNVSSQSMDLEADVEGKGEVVIDLNNQQYTVNGFTLTTRAKGASLPGEALEATLGADVVARLAEQAIDVASVSLKTLGIELDGQMAVTDLDSEPQIKGSIGSNVFVPAEVMQALGIERPVTADESVLKEAELSASFSASPTSAELGELAIRLDDTNFTGTAGVPSLAGGMPPLRFDFDVDAIDVDRYLPPPSDAPEGEEEAPTESPEETPEGGGADAPIALPTDMLRQLDVDGVLRVGRVKVSNLVTEDIEIPVKAKNGRLAVEGLGARLYQGAIKATASLDAGPDVPAYGVDFALDGIQAEPLLADLMQKDAFLSGGGQFALNIATTGQTLNELIGALDGNFNTAFTDGSINGINIGYQIRRAKAALTGNKLSADEKTVKTDFSSLKVSGTFDDGVLKSNDLDMRSPLLRLGGAGLVDLPGHKVDYTLTTLITGTAQGQGGKDLESLKGVELGIPIKAGFDELAANFSGVILKGMRDNITGNLANEAKARAKAEADRVKAQAREQLKAREAELKAKADEAKQKAEDELKSKAKDKLRGLLGN